MLIPKFFTTLKYYSWPQFKNDSLAGLFVSIVSFPLAIAFALVRLGTVIKSIPYPVVVGFSSGIAVIIFSSQINDFLGLRFSNIPAHFLAQWKMYLSYFNQVNFYSLILFFGCILFNHSGRNLTQFHRAQSLGSQFILSGINPHLLEVLKNSQMWQVLGKLNVCLDINAVFARAQKNLTQVKSA